MAPQGFKSELLENLKDLGKSREKLTWRKRCCIVSLRWQPDKVVIFQVPVMNQSLDKQLGLKVEIWKSLIWRMRETRQYSGKIDNHTSVNTYLRPRRKRQTDESYYMITSIGGNPVPCKIINSKHLVDKNHVWQTKNHVLLNLIGSINYKKHHFF